MPPLSPHAKQMDRIRISAYEWELLESEEFFLGLTKADWYYLFLSTGDSLKLNTLREFYDPTKELLVETDVSDFALQAFQVPTDRRILKSVSSNLAALSLLTPREFEVFFAELLDKLGYSDVVLGPGSKDDGIDVMAALDHDFGKERILVQCKKHGSENKVGLSTIKQLLWDVQAHNAARGLIVTTSSFTKPAERLVRLHAHRITAIDIQAIDNVLKGLQENR